MHLSNDEEERHRDKTSAHTVNIQSLMASVGDSLHQFVDHGVRVNQAYYCNVMLFQQLLPAICKISSKFIFQQDSALAHRTLRQSTFPHNYQILSNFKNSFKTDSAVN